MEQVAPLPRTRGVEVEAVGPVAWGQPQPGQLAALAAILRPTAETTKGVGPVALGPQAVTRRSKDFAQNTAGLAVAVHRLLMQTMGRKAVPPCGAAAVGVPAANGTETATGPLAGHGGLMLLAAVELRVAVVLVVLAVIMRLAAETAAGQAAIVRLEPLGRAGLVECRLLGAAVVVRVIVAHRESAGRAVGGRSAFILGDSVSYGPSVVGMWMR